VQKNLIRNFIASQMNGSLRSNSLKVGFSLLVLLLGAQACVHVPAPVYTNYDRAWNVALCAAQETGIDLMTVDRSGGFIRGSRDGIDVTITVRPPGRRHDPSSERF
jgi:hypothetical protein